MNCRDLDDRLDALLAGNLSPDERRAVDEHLARCDRCRELDALVHAGLPDLESAEDPELTDAILRRTSGRACERAHELLPDLADGSLAGGDAELIGLHVERCGACAELARTLAWLREELPEMASVEPAPGFVAEVMRATVRRRQPWAERLEAVRAFFGGLVQRPRFALEASYVGAILLLLVFATPFSPLRDVPSQALALTRVNPVEAIEASMPGMRAQIVAASHQAWEATGGRVLARTRPARADLGDKVRRAWVTSRALPAQGIAMWGALFDGNLEESGRQWREMGTTLKRMWIELVTSETTEPTERGQDV